jgi:predicted Zn-dependent peptidase
MQHYQQTLANGLTVVGEHSSEARSLALGFFVRTGARDEMENESGVSHFLEHMLFKGTAKRSAEAVNRDFDAMGARYNAFTSGEETVYYGACLPQFQSGMTELLADMMRPALRPSDF